MTDAVRLTRLPNGLTIVSEHMPRVETVSFGAYVAAGTRHESAAENGVSHFLEHMAFKGTEKRDAAGDRPRDRECRRPPERLHRPREHRLLLQGAEGGCGRWPPTSSATS